MEDWAEIRRLHRAEGMPIRAIARKLGLGRNTVRRALAADGPLKYERSAKGSIVDAVEPQVRELLAAWPRMPVPVIAERIGWQRGMTVLKDRVRELRPVFTQPDPVSRTVYLPGELAQCDLWFPPVDISLGFGQVGRPPVLVMVSGYSRVIAARMIPSRQGPDLLAGHWALIRGFGRVPKSAIVSRSYDIPILDERCGSFAHHVMLMPKLLGSEPMPSLPLSGRERVCRVLHRIAERSRADLTEPARPPAGERPAGAIAAVSPSPRPCTGP